MPSRKSKSKPRRTRTLGQSGKAPARKTSHGAAAARAKPAGKPHLAALTAAQTAALFLLVAVAYFPATNAGFVWDDVLVTLARPIHDWGGLWQIWFAPRSLGDYEGHYWPLLYSTFWLEHKLWGLNPLGYHGINLVLHATVAAVLWRLMLLLKVPGAWLIAAVFAVHPVHVEPAVWIIGRKDLLATGFYLASLYAYFHFSESARPAHCRYYYAAAVAAFTAALLCKSSAITLPVALLLLHWWKHAAVTRAHLKAVAPFVVIAVALTALDLSIYKFRDPTSFDYSLIERALIAAHTVGFYAGKLLLPTDLAGIYPHWHVGIGDWVGWLCAAVTVAAAAALWFARARIGRAPLVAVAFFILALAPTSGVVDYGYMLFSLVADRYQYLASIGLHGLIIGGAVYLSRRLLQRLNGGGGRRVLQAVFCTAAAALLATFGALSWQHAAIYRDNYDFYSHVLKHNPTARYAHHSLGQSQHKRGEFEAALASYQRDMELAPSEQAANLRLARNHQSIGRSLEALGRVAEAETNYNEAVKRMPEYAPAVDDLAGFYLRQKRHAEAVPHFATLLRIAPQVARYHTGHGAALAGLGRNEEALASHERALALDPGLEMARANRDRLLEFMGRK